MIGVVLFGIERSDDVAAVRHPTELDSIYIGKLLQNEPGRTVPRWIRQKPRFILLRRSEVVDQDIFPVRGKAERTPEIIFASKWRRSVSAQGRAQRIGDRDAPGASLVLGKCCQCFPVGGECASA